MFGFFRRSGNASRTSGNDPPTYEFILDGLEKRQQALDDGEKRSANEKLGERVRELATKVNDQYVAQHPGATTQASAGGPTTQAELGRTLHGIMTRLGELEADRLVLPPSLIERQRFRDNELSVWRKTPEKMADLRYLGVWGHYDPRDARKSDWRVIEANRFIIKGQEEADASRERCWAIAGIIVAFAVGMVAAGAAVLAIPTKDSIFCQTIGSCDKGQDKPDAVSAFATS
jgi:hypothetical protein